jgi:hypothetical protein
MRNSGSDGEGGGLLSTLVLTHSRGKVDRERNLNLGTNRSEAVNYL